MNKRKLLQRVLHGSKNISFNDMASLVQAFGFHLSRTKGSHHIYAHPDIPELLNLQEVGGKTKPYQIRQFVKLIEKYNLTIGDES